MEKRVLRVLWMLLQWTWCLPQNLVGGCMALWLRKHQHMRFHGAFVTAWKHRGCTSMGCFIFMDERALRHTPLLIHEYGHTVQSAVLGWLYLPVIVLPSVLWFSVPAFRRYRRRKRMSYYRFYTEKWANRWGEKACGDRSMGDAIID